MANKKKKSVILMYVAKSLIVYAVCINHMFYQDALFLFLFSAHSFALFTLMVIVYSNLTIALIYAKGTIKCQFIAVVVSADLQLVIKN